MKYASLGMQGGRTVYGILTRLALLSLTRQCRIFLNYSRTRNT
ncbi:unknown protein [Cronobacter turicensis z3032]|uniref:Uncharacterized protein n=1 Tax=Cronobacter turicensis (strain DSM 18703 / CCUG 55852 / LMG 23827 / z3032) TaxID=693216 RepID=C9Y3J1_CROTZ|nr:unknown protein [Cronobacter turicensis z3032]